MTDERRPRNRCGRDLGDGALDPGILKREEDEQTRQRAIGTDRRCGRSSCLGFLAGMVSVLVTVWGESGGCGRLPRFFCVGPVRGSGGEIR